MSRSLSEKLGMQFTGVNTMMSAPECEALTYARYGNYEVYE